MHIKSKKNNDQLKTDNSKLSKTLAIIQKEINKTQMNLINFVKEQENKN